MSHSKTKQQQQQQKNRKKQTYICDIHATQTNIQNNKTQIATIRSRKLLIRVNTKILIHECINHTEDY